MIHSHIKNSEIIRNDVGKIENIRFFAHKARGITQKDTNSIIHEGLKAPGESLTKITNPNYSSKLGQDFSDVKVYSNEISPNSARMVGASVYTFGKKIVLRKGKISPPLNERKKLLVHDFIHVKQQNVNGSDVPSVLSTRSPDDRLEQEAETISKNVDNYSRNYPKYDDLFKISSLPVISLMRSPGRSSIGSPCLNNCNDKFNACLERTSLPPECFPILSSCSRICEAKETGINVTSAARSFPSGPSGIPFGGFMDGDGIKFNPTYWIVEYLLERGNQQKKFNSLTSPLVWPQVTNFLDNNSDWNNNQTTLTVKVRINPNMGAAAAISDVWNPQSASNYRFDCFIATNLSELRGIFLTYRSGNKSHDVFNTDYNSFQLTMTNPLVSTSLEGSALQPLSSSHLSLKTDSYQQELQMGDWVYIKNPFLTGAWSGENAIYLGGDKFWGHPIGSFNPTSYAKYLFDQVLATFAKPGVRQPKNADEILDISYIKPIARPRPMH